MTTQSHGSLVISLDTELAWGAVHRGSYGGREQEFDRTRYVIDELLSMFEDYQIHATWAVVGHLFLEGCGPDHGIKHPEIHRPSYERFSGDWFDRDPCSSVDDDPWWYGADIVRRILDSPVRQEIGSHNFSHVIVGQEGCSRETFDSELRASQRAAAQWGIELKSFVFPRNAIGHVDLLAERGFACYRGNAPTWTARLPGVMQRLGRLVDNFLPIPSPVVQPVLHGGVVNIPASFNYLHRSGWGRYVPISVRVQKAVAAMRRSAETGGVFHLWTHPFNIASDPDALLAGLRQIFQEYKNLRESGLIQSRTMTDVAEITAAQMAS